MENRKVSFTARTLVFVLSLFVLTFSVSYSYFSVTPVIEATTEQRTATVTTDILDYNFETSQYINNENLVLIKESEIADRSEKSIFTVSKKNGRTYTIKYNIYLTNVTISDNLKSADFKWELLENGSPIALYSGNFANAATGEDFMLTADPIVLKDASSASYELRIWLQETDVDQAGLFNGNFRAKVAVEVATVGPES